MKKTIFWVFLAIIASISAKVKAQEVSLFPYVEEGEIVGFCNLEKKLIVKVQCLDALPFSEGLGAVKKRGGQKDSWGFIDEKGKQVIAPKFEKVKSFKNGLAWVKLNDKWGLIDKTGKEIVKPMYDNLPFGKDYVLDNFDEGVARISIKDKWGLIDKTGKEIVKPKYNKIRPFKEGLAAVELNNKWGYIDAQGKEVVAPKYSEVQDFSEGLACVKENVSKGYIDKTGKEVIPQKYIYADDFSEGLAPVYDRSIGDTYVFIDKTNKIVLSTSYDRGAKPFSEGVAAVRSEISGWGLIDKKGKEIVKPKYERIENMKEGIAVVYYNGYYGYIDKNGKEITPISYENANDFKGGFAVIERSRNEYYFIDKTGKEISSKFSGVLEDFGNGVFQIRLESYSENVDYYIKIFPDGKIVEFIDKPRITK